MATRIVMTCLVMAVAAAGVPADQFPVEDSQLAALGSQNQGERIDAQQQVAKVGAPAIRPLLGVMDADRRTAGKMASGTLFDIVQNVVGSDHAGDVIDALTRELKAEHAVLTHRYILRLLSLVGDDRCVDAIYKKVSSPELGEMAVFALSRIPGMRASQALVGARQLTEHREKIGIIVAMGKRDDMQTLPYLIPYAVGQDAEYAEAALDALAEMPTPRTSAVMIFGVKRNTPGAIWAALKYVETMLDAGDPESAAAVLKALSASSSLSPAQLGGVLRGWALAGGQDANRQVLGGLDHENPHVRGAALEACTLLRGKKATNAIAGRMSSAPGQAKSELLRVLGQRGQWMTPEAAKKIANVASTSPNAEVRVAAIKAIETAAIAQGVPAILRQLASPAGPVRDAAEHAVNHMASPAMTEAIIAELTSASPEVRAMLVLALGYRGGDKAAETIIPYADDEAESVRAAAYKALGVLRANESFDVLLAAFDRPDATDRLAAERAMRRLEGDAATARMLEAYKDASDIRKPSLLRVIGYRKHADIPALLAQEVASDNDDVRAAAVAGLGRQNDPALAEKLLDVARRGPTRVTQAAMDGILRAARLAEGSDREKAGSIFLDAVPLAVTDDQKREALDGVVRCVEGQRTDSLSVVEPLMMAGTVRSEAARAVIHFAIHLPQEDKDRAVSLLTTAVELSPGAKATAKAVDRLRQLGVDIDPAQSAGFITQWWLIGPIPNPGNEMWDKVYPPETEGVDLAGKVSIEGREYTWQHYRTEDLQGIVSLTRAIADKDNIGAFGYAEITVESDQNVLLKVGSDDSIVIWINDEKAHTFNGSRGVVVDQDTAKASLKKGANRVLVKSLDVIHDWGFCIRVTTPDGSPAVFTQRKK